MTDIAQAHAQLLRDASLQFRFLNPAAQTSLSVEPAKAWWLFKVGQVQLWPLVAIAAIVLAVLVVQVIRKRGLPGLPRNKAAISDKPASSAIIPASALADADALARAGRYGAAVHALLLGEIGAIQDRFPRALTPAHTSRDIAALSVLSPAFLDVFSTMASQVERAVFAKIPLRREEWEVCRALYASLPDPKRAMLP